MQKCEASGRECDTGPVADFHFVKIPEGGIVDDRVYQTQKASPRPLPGCSISLDFLKRSGQLWVHPLIVTSFGLFLNWT